jgi:hypothetical protein
MKSAPYDFPPASAADLRRWAIQCAAQANDPLMSGDNRDRLLKMRQSLLSLADTEDWLRGKIEEGHTVANRHMS